MFPHAYLSKGGNLPAKNKFIQHWPWKIMKLTAKPGPTFFRLRFQTRAEQEDPTSDSQQGKGNKILVPSKIWQHCPEKPGEKMIQSGQSWVVLSERSSSKKSPFHSPKYKMEWFWHLTPSQGEAAPADLAISQHWCNERKASFLALRFLSLPTRAWILSGTWIPHPLGWDLLILNQLIGRMRSQAFCNSREGFNPWWDCRFI